MIADAKGAMEAMCEMEDKNDWEAHPIEPIDAKTKEDWFNQK